MINKKLIISEHSENIKNTGDSSVQIALFTARINVLNEHLKINKKDFATTRGLLKLVSKRRSLLDYIKRRDEKKYQDLIKKLNIRK
ncbi:MAG: 30S ribosomal protein S15 [Rickettsiales bacterium]